MAIEAKRGCGYRKVGGLYLVSRGLGVACDRLPIPLTVCPCCAAGFKQTRGWTWLDANRLVGGHHQDCIDPPACPLCHRTEEMAKAGLLWIGERFYPTPNDFTWEAAQLGISRRIAAVPRDFRLGVTWVLLAHPKTVFCQVCHGSGLNTGVPCEACRGTGKTVGIFHVFRPEAIEKIVTFRQSGDTSAMEDLQKRGITPVIVPDDDRDHQGSVYEKEGN